MCVGGGGGGGGGGGVATILIEFMLKLSFWRRNGNRTCVGHQHSLRIQSIFFFCAATMASGHPTPPQWTRSESDILATTHHHDNEYKRGHLPVLVKTNSYPGKKYWRCVPGADDQYSHYSKTSECGPYEIGTQHDNFQSPK